MQLVCYLSVHAPLAAVVCSVGARCSPSIRPLILALKSPIRLLGLSGGQAAERPVCLAAAGMGATVASAPASASVLVSRPPLVSGRSSAVQVGALHCVKQTDRNSSDSFLWTAVCEGHLYICTHTGTVLDGQVDII